MIREALLALVDERTGIFRRRHAADAARLCFVVVNAARFLGETLAHVLRLADHLAQHPHRHRL